MATKVGGILVNLGLDVAQIKQDVGKANRELSGFRQKVDRRMGRIQKSVGRAVSSFQALAAVVGGAALVRSIQNTANSLEDVDRMAESVGARRSGIQELTFAFRQFRLEQDDVADALGTLADRSQDAMDGMQSFIDDFKLVGIEVEDLRNKRPGELLDLFAQKISKVEDPTKRTAAAVRIFGDDLGRKLLPMLMEGEEGMERFRKEAREAGAVMSDELVKDGAEAARTFRRLQETMGAQFTRAVAESAEELESIAEALTNVATGVSTVVSNIVEGAESIGEGIAAALHGPASDDIPRLQDRLESLREVQKHTLEELGRSRLLRINPFASDADLRTDLQETNAEMIRIQKRLQELREEGEEGGGKSKPVTIDVTGGKPDTQLALDEEFWRALDAGAFEFNDTLKMADGTIADLSMGMEDLEEKGTESISEMDAAINGWASNFSSTLADAVMGAEASFDKIAESFTKMMLEMAIQQAVVQPMLKSAGVEVSGGAANGGPVGGGKMYEVNERGNPELLNVGGKQYLMMGKQGGHVTALDKSGGLPSGGGGGGDNVRIVVNNNSGQEATVTESQGPDLQRQIDIEVGRSIREGSGRRAAMETFAIQPRTG